MRSPRRPASRTSRSTSVPDGVRLFLALNLPPDVRAALHAAAEPLRAAAPRGVGWVRPDGLHLTLKFLGDVERAGAEALVAALAPAVARHLAPTLEVRGVGAFPNPARPRVVWAGVEAAPRLELLQHEVEAICATLGYEVEGRAFRPHITLGRVRDDAPREVLAALAAAVPATSVSARVAVDTVDLMESTLLPGGARHEAVARLPLREE